MMGVSYMSMAVNWIELAQKMAQAARAGVAIERKRLQEILAERQRKQQPHDVPESDVRRRYQRQLQESSDSDRARRPHHPVRQLNRRGLPAYRGSRAVWK